MDSEKLLLVVPYRDREEHLSLFVPHMEKWLKAQGIDFNIIISEQSKDGEWFNKGSLINCGFKEANKGYDYVCIHDIDMLPCCKKTCDYSYSASSIHLASRVQQFGYKMPGKNYTGGVIMCPVDIYIKANGFSNLYKGWGKEDIDFGFRIRKAKSKISKRDGKYSSLEHQKQKWHPDKKFDDKMLQSNKQLLKNMISGKHDFRKDGLSNIKYKILNTEIISSKTKKITFDIR